MCAGALVIPDGPYPVLSAITSGVGQATSDGDPIGATGTCAAAAQAGEENGVWYKWTPALSGVYELKLCNPPTATSGPGGATPDTVMATFINPLGCAGG